MVNLIIADDNSQAFVGRGASYDNRIKPETGVLFLSIFSTSLFLFYIIELRIAIKAHSNEKLFTVEVIILFGVGGGPNFAGSLGRNYYTVERFINLLYVRQDLNSWGRVTHEIHEH